MKILYAALLTACLCFTRVQAAETVPLLGTIGQQTSKSCFLKKRSALCCVAACSVVALATGLITSSINEATLCAPADTNMTGLCWSPVRRDHIWRTLFFGKVRCPLATNTTITAQYIMFSPEVAEIAKLKPDDAIICIHQASCKKLYPHGSKPVNPCQH